MKGTGPFSEPETRSMREMLDAYSNICCMVDVHSYSELILYPWGDDESQTTDPSMNFANSGYDGLRGTLGDTLYKEYIPQSDLDWYVATGSRVRDAIAAVRGRVYTVQASVSLYPTTGTSHDYACARLLEEHSAELLNLLRKGPGLREASIELMEPVLEVVLSRRDDKPLVFKDDGIRSSEKRLEYAGEMASPALRRTMKRLLGDLQYFAGRSVMDGLNLASERNDVPK